MQMRQLGLTQLRTTRIGLGLAALGRPGYINIGHGHDLNHETDVEAMESRAHSVLDVAWQVGIRYFDTARSYGLGERFLGSWLQSRALRADQLTIGSKWGYTYTAGWQVEAEQHEVKDHSLSTLERQWIESWSLLGDYLRLYQVHSATLDSGILEDSAVLSRLSELKASGVHIGLTLSGAQQAETLSRAIDITMDGQRLFDCVQATWNVLETSAGPQLEQAHAAGMGIIVKEALANGRLTPRNDDPDFAHVHQQLAAQARRLNTTLDALALAAALAQPWADIVLSGAARADHLRANIACMDVVLDEEAVNVMAALAEPPDEYWRKRSHLEWN